MLAVSAMIATACSDGGGETDEESTSTETTDTGAEGEGSAEGFTYTTGIFEDTTSDNFWAYMDTESTVWNAYVLGPTKGALYGINFPDIEVAPLLAADETPPEPVEEDGGWSVTVNLKDGLTWSDGSPLTAEDFVFTFETVRDAELSGNWSSQLPVAADGTTGIESVEAVSETEIKYIFNDRPGLGTWPHSVGVAPVMSKAFWEDEVSKALEGENPSRSLYQASGQGDPSSGPMIFEEREAGAFARTVANPEYAMTGETVDFEGAGGGSFEIGPFAEEQVFSLYGGQDPAVLALQEGEVDYLYNPLGMQRGLRDQIVEDENLTAISNPTNGMRYLAFNVRSAPMNDPAFRKAIATMIDREFMATSVLQGVAFPLFTATPQANTKWFNQEKADELSQEYREFETPEARFQAAVDILKEAGYTWESEPELVDEEDGSQTVVPGEGIMGPDGETIGELELLAPSPGYDPLRSTYAVWVQQWAEQLGIPLVANPTNFNVIVSKVFSGEEKPDFDMFILGWSLGNPAFPTFYEDFWGTNGGSNPLGYSNEELDQATRRYLASTDEESAYEILWNEIEPILAEDLPYVYLFDTPILEFYRAASVTYPYTETLGGIQFQNGMTDQVRAAS
jgi:peptide/nickel transport system substrate-binding protein